MSLVPPSKLLGIMGTGSDVGKSLIVAGLARQLVQAAHKVVPFKAQNMASNAAPALLRQDEAQGKTWGEIGRAQALQASAAGLLPSVLMNPILLKPIEGRMRVHLDGKVAAQEGWQAYKQRTPDLADFIDRRLAELCVSHGADICLIEGAGSCVELNLAKQDLANLALINRYLAPWILVGDIDRGGIYAQILGVRACLESAVWDRCVGVVINRLRGDPQFFADGQRDLAERIAKPVYVIPHLEAHGLPDEDGFGLSRVPKRGLGPNKACIVHLPQLAMSDDLEPIASDPLWHVEWCKTPPVETPEALILPGSTDSLADARFLWNSDWADSIRRWAKLGVPIVGVCGGYHLLGESISDPDAVDGQGGTCKGLGLLPVHTVMDSHKLIRPVLTSLDGHAISGYEIHHGRSTCHGAQPLLDAGEDRGCILGSVAGCHIHGLFASAKLRRKLLGHGSESPDHMDPLDRWAQHLRDHGLCAEQLLEAIS